MSVTEVEQSTAEHYIPFLTTSKPEDSTISNLEDSTISRTQDSSETLTPVEIDVAPKDCTSPAVPTSNGNEDQETRTLQFSSEPLPAPPTFEDKYKEREYLKSRLTLAFRIFAKLGFDNGIAGHITLRVRVLLRLWRNFLLLIRF